jgi:hypothetical protein
MYTIQVEKECNCFKQSGFDNNTTFETKEDALMRAKVMECRMNQEFCFNHFFEAVDYGDTIKIHSTLRPEDDEDGDDLRELLAKRPVTIQFNSREETPNGSCCGGGHCS